MVIITKRLTCIVLFLALAMAVFGGCRALSPLTIRGEGQIVSQSFDVNAFSGINVSGAKDVVFRYSNNSSVTIEMHENLFEYLEHGVRADIIQIGFRSNINITTNNRVKVYVYSPNMMSVDISGSVEVQDWDTIRAEHFSIDVSGSGRIALATRNHSKH